jgi:hypothetical protein
MINHPIATPLANLIAYWCARETCHEKERGVCFWAAEPPKNTPHLIPFDNI